MGFLFWVGTGPTGVWGRGLCYGRVRKKKVGFRCFSIPSPRRLRKWVLKLWFVVKKLQDLLIYWTLQLQGPNLCWIFVKENKLTSYRKQKGLSRSRGTSLGSFFEDAFRQIWQRCKFCTTWYASLYLFIYLLSLGYQHYLGVSCLDTLTVAQIFWS